MAIVSKPKTFTAGTVAVSADVNSDYDTLYNDYNGNITNANIAAAAAIADTKLATISSGGKVNISALTATSQAAGDIMYASSASAYARLAKGLASQHLAMNGAATAPEWVTPTAAASAAEVKTGSESAKYVAPSTMTGHEGMVKGWISFNGTGTIAIKDSYNVSGIVDDAAALWTVTWATDFADANYAVVASCINYNHISTVMIKTKAAGSVQIISVGQNGSTTYDNDDLSDVNVIAIGDR